MDFLNFRDPVSAWSHCTWMVLSVPATYLLLRRCSGDLSKRIALLVFGMSLALCYAGSTLYHGIRLSGPRLDLFDRLDHIGIFILIAGSYTPLAWTLLKGGWRWGTLAAAWGLAGIGTILLLSHVMLPPVYTTATYLAMGWGVILCYFEIARSLSHRALLPLVIGGVFYSIGAVLNLLEWPVILPGLVRAHEVFHLLVMAGSLSHYWFMLYVVAPLAPLTAAS